LILGDHLASWDGIWSIKDFCSLGSINDAEDMYQYGTVWNIQRTLTVAIPNLESLSGLEELHPTMLLV
jgi:hypothetical protein